MPVGHNRPQTGTTDGLTDRNELDSAEFIRKINQTDRHLANKYEVNKYEVNNYEAQKSTG